MVSHNNNPLVAPTRLRSHQQELQDLGLDFPFQCNNNPDGSPRLLKCNGKDINRCRRFKYLGRVLTDTNDDSIALLERIKIARGTYMSLNRRVLSHRRLRPETRYKIYNSICTAQVLYGQESMTPGEHARRVLDRFQQKALRNIFGLNPT